MSSDVQTDRTRVRRSNYELENALGIAAPIVAPFVPSFPWTPAEPVDPSWIRPSKLRRRFLDLSVTITVHETDLPELNEKVAFVNSVWAHCNKIRGKLSPYYRNRKYSLRKLASLAVAFNAGDDFHMAYLVCRKHAEACTAQKWHVAQLPSVGWIPFHARQIDFWGDSFHFGSIKATPAVFQPFVTPKSFCDGSFNRDDAGRWYIDTSIEVDELDMRLER